jgi:hypothetical protein
MARRNIGHGWTLDLPDEFASREAEDDHHVFWSAGRTVYAVVYKAAGGDAEAALAQLAADRGVRPAERFERRDGSLTGEAWLLPEVSDDGKQYWGLNTYTSSPAGSVACVTIYVDRESDLPFARALWSTVAPSTTAATGGGVN